MNSTEAISVAKKKSGIDMPIDATPKYDSSYPLEAQMGMVPLTQPELPVQKEPKHLPHKAKLPIKIY
jgi:hypothetical protein